MPSKKASQPASSSSNPAASANARPAAADAQTLLGNDFVAEQMRAKVGDPKAPAAGTPAAARALHLQHQNLVATTIAAGLKHEPRASAGVDDFDTLFHNAAEWVAEEEVTLTVLSPTHDSAARKTHKLAMFDTRTSYPDKGGDYNAADKADHAGLEFVKEGTHGGLEKGGDELRIIAPDDAAEVKELLVHEVQHDADQSWAGQAFEEKPDKWAANATEAWNNYASEFRAWWIGSPERFGSDARKLPSSHINAGRSVTWDEAAMDHKPNGRYFSKTPRFANERQTNVFWHLVDNYRYVAKFAATDPKFLARAEKLTGPKGGNLVNSVRIQWLSEALSAAKPDLGADDPAIQAVLTAAYALDTVDRTYLADRDASERLWSQARAALSPELFARFERAVFNRERVAAPVGLPGQRPTKSPDAPIE